jgi:hypothetical protein
VAEPSPSREGGAGRDRGPARHELPELDAAALEAARAADRLLLAARAFGADRWIRYVTPLPDRLRDDPIPSLRLAARQARAAYGPKDSIRDSLPPDVTEPFLEAIDRLLKAIARHEAHRD